MGGSLKVVCVCDEWSWWLGRLCYFLLGFGEVGGGEAVGTWVVSVGNLVCFIGFL